MIEVYTCITNSIDDASTFSNRYFYGIDARYTIFTDKQIDVQGWTVNPVDSKFGSLKTPRWYKANSHLLFPNAEATIWIDGNQIPNGDISFILEKGPLATFEHPKRDCIYEEIKACDKMGKDTMQNMLPQLENYREIGYPEHYGLAETSFIYRENTPNINKFNTKWWEEIHKYSHRDQLSFNFVAYILGIQYNIIPGNRLSSSFLQFIGDH